MTGVGGGVWDEWLAAERARRDRADVTRAVEVVAHEGKWVRTEQGERLLNLTSNDYLGLAGHPKVIEGATRALRRGGGAMSARLMAGTDGGYAALEDKLAGFHRCGAALVFGSGYLANLGTISALVGRHDAVFSDRLNHASIVDGCALSGADVYRYRHGDMDDLEAMLTRAETRSPGRKLIVTESIFSMDGDVAPLRELCELRDRFGAALMLDEAHALGVLGPGGTGYAAQLGLSDQVDLLIGTFGKALGSYGAYVAAARPWIDCLTNAARTFLFSTALPPAAVGAADAALDLLSDADGARHVLAASAQQLRGAFGAMALDIRGSTTHIVPVVVDSSTRAIALARALRADGVFVRAIRPPTVAAGSSRLRFSVTALLGADDIATIAQALGRCIDALDAQAPR